MPRPSRWQQPGVWQETREGLSELSVQSPLGAVAWLSGHAAGRDHLLAVEVDVRGRWSYAAWITRRLSKAAGASIQKRLPARTCR